MRQLTHSLVSEMLERAAAAPRRRTHHLLHSGHEDPLQRYVVAGQPDSYFRPHRHLARGELATLVHGAVEVLEFGDAGELLARCPFGAGQDGFAWETQVGTWHTLLPRGPFAFLEVKLGPFDPATAVDYAEWAPAEGEAGVPAFRQWLATAAIGDRFSR